MDGWMDSINVEPWVATVAIVVTLPYMTSWVYIQADGPALVHPVRAERDPVTKLNPPIIAYSWYTPGVY